jgi:hypothetical protein
MPASLPVTDSALRRSSTVQAVIPWGTSPSGPAGSRASTSAAARAHASDPPFGQDQPEFLPRFRRPTMAIVRLLYPSESSSFRGSGTNGLGRAAAIAARSFHRSQSQVTTPPARLPTPMQSRSGAPSAVELPNRESPANRPRIVPTPAPRATLQSRSSGLFTVSVPSPPQLASRVSRPSRRLPETKRRQSAAGGARGFLPVPAADWRPYSVKMRRRSEDRASFGRRYSTVTDLARLRG